MRRTAVTWLIRNLPMMVKRAYLLLGLFPVTSSNSLLCLTMSQLQGRHAWGCLINFLFAIYSVPYLTCFGSGAMATVVLMVMVAHLRMTGRDCADSTSRKHLKWILALLPKFRCKPLEMLCVVKNLRIPRKPYGCWISY